MAADLPLPYALDEVPLDPELDGTPTKVYLYLIRRLDRAEYRPVKAWALAVALQIRPQTAGKALRVLVEKGYLQQAPLDSGEGARAARRYRLLDARDESSRLAPERH